jgi:hypothetical protein
MLSDWRISVSDHGADAPDQGDVETTDQRRRLPIVGVVVAIVVVAVVGTVIWVALAQGAGDGPDEIATEEDVDIPTTETGTVAEFEGDGDDSTEEVEVAGNWQVEWEATGDEFQVELINEEGESRGTIVDSGGESEGATFITEGGTFTLEITSDDEWSIAIHEGGGE